MSTLLRQAKSISSYNPIPGGCVLHLPLWHPSLSGPVFKSQDRYGHVCTVIGALAEAEGRWFDAVNDNISVGNHGTVQLSNNFTIVAWVNTDSITDVQKTSVGRRTGANNWQFTIGNDGGGNGGKLRFTGWVAAAEVLVAQAAAAIGVNTWYHVCVTYSALGLFIYQDNVQVANVATQGALDTNGTATTIGAMSTAGTRAWSNLIGDVWFYNRVLSAAERAFHMAISKWRY